VRPTTVANEEEFEIEPGLPIPDSARGPVTRYPWSKMQIGDSILVEFKGRNATALRGNVMKSARYHAKKHGKRFAARTTSRGIRVWRMQ